VIPKPLAPTSAKPVLSEGRHPPREGISFIFPNQEKKKKKGNFTFSPRQSVDVADLTGLIPKAPETD